ncbi:lysoplasmalogenase [Aquirufa ecclesiirivi]|uniref:lysoplasmalogenase n=1 Tax=Aquirufa ecclesiirivi TaxID=2715124 RepID=UPI00140D4B88|nr:lysoplasmalogenase [Aquirufa ecclesiirivi]NHC48794.1 lysoplasmalogenase [Aquirufa ecclesiirivi]
MKEPRLFLLLYGIAAFMDVIIPMLFPSFAHIRYVAKPALMLLLMAYVFTSNDVERKPTILLALFFAWLGDVFLMIPGSSPLFFQLGLGGFLIMQWIYIDMFRKQISKVLSPVNGMTLIVSIYVIGLLSLLLPSMNLALAIPVIIYAISLGTMLWFASQRKSSVSRWNYQCILSGATLFVVSDSLLAINKFYYSFPGNSFWVMSTYILAQLLLTQGLVKLRS